MARFQSEVGVDYFLSLEKSSLGSNPREHMLYVLEKKGKVTYKCSAYRLVKRGHAIGEIWDYKNHFDYLLYRKHSQVIE